MRKYTNAAAEQQPKTTAPKTEVLQALGEFEIALGECMKLLPQGPAESAEGERFQQMRLALDLMKSGSEGVRAIIASEWPETT